MHTVETLLQELQTLLRAGTQDDSEGIAARNPSQVAAALLEHPVSRLEHGTRCYEPGLARTQALDFLSQRVSPERGYELLGYDGEGFEGFFLKVPVRRAPILIGPDERRQAPVEYWSRERRAGLLVRCTEDYDGEIRVDCWSREPGAGVALIGEVDEAVRGCTLTHGRAIRLGASEYTFLPLPAPRHEPRHAAHVEAAAEMVARHLRAGEAGERLGTLWYGPPGNGKTSMVRRLFRECDAATRLWIDPSTLYGSELERTFALLARILRSLAEGDAALVVFEDVDLLSGTRGGGEIRTWLSALDGVERYRCRLCFVGLTNVPPHELDPAVVRPARLGDLLVEFGPPDRARRRLILGDLLGSSLDAATLDRLALRSEGFSGAELELLRRRARWAGGERLGDPEALDRLVRESRPVAAAAPVGFRR